MLATVIVDTLLLILRFYPLLHLIHVVSVRLVVEFFALTLLADLVSEHLIDLLLLQPIPLLQVDVLLTSLFILLNALLNVFLLLLELELLAIVFNHICHVVHKLLDAAAPLLRLPLTLLLSLESHAHVLLDL